MGIEITRALHGAARHRVRAEPHHLAPGVGSGTTCHRHRRLHRRSCGCSRSASASTTCIEEWTGARLTTTLTRVGGLMADVPDGWTGRLREWCAQVPEDARRGRPDAAQERHLARPHPGRGRHDRRGGDRTTRSPAPCCAPAAWRTTCARTTRTSATRRTISRCRSASTATCTTATWCAWRRCGSRCASSLQALDRLPDGPINVDDPRVILPPKQRAMSDMESMIHHFKQVMEGVRGRRSARSTCRWRTPRASWAPTSSPTASAKPVRWRIRPPSFLNLAALPKMAEGHLLSRPDRHQRERRHRDGGDRPVSRRRRTDGTDAQTHGTAAAELPPVFVGEGRKQLDALLAQLPGQGRRRCCRPCGWCRRRTAGSRRRAWRRSPTSSSSRPPT